MRFKASSTCLEAGGMYLKFHLSVENVMAGLSAQYVGAGQSSQPMKLVVVVFSVERACRNKRAL